MCLARDVATSAIFFSCFAAAKHLLGDWSGESAASSSFLPASLRRTSMMRRSSPISRWMLADAQWAVDSGGIPVDGPGGTAASQSQ